MAISINWSTQVIFVPKADTTLIQLNPIEIRELNINSFRLALKALEAGGEGMIFPDTHRHNTEVLLGGIVYARVIEIINGYTITFEDGSYAVNLVGANSNIGDVLNLNTVSVRSANAAGLISNAAIEYSSFNGGVTVDITSTYSGTVFPVGTPQQPVNNLEDAMLIAEVRGFTTIYMIGNVTIDAGGNYSEMVFIGESMTKSTLDISSAANVDKCEFYEATMTGTLDGNSKLKNCRVLNLNYIYGIVEQCMLGPGIIVLGGSAEAHFLDCWSGVAGSETPVIDCGGSGQDLALRNYNGGIKIINKIGVDKISIDLNSGQVVLDSTVSDGDIQIRGIGFLADNSTGTAVVNTEALISIDQISKATWDAMLSSHLIAGTTGKKLSDGGTGDPGEIAAAVWDADKTDYDENDTMGELQNQIDGLAIAKPKVIPGE